MPAAVETDIYIRHDKVKAGGASSLPAPAHLQTIRTTHLEVHTKVQNTGGKKNLGFQYFGCVIPRKPVKTVLKRLNRFSVNRFKQAENNGLNRFLVLMLTPR